MMQFTLNDCCFVSTILVYMYIWCPWDPHPGRHKAVTALYLWTYCFPFTIQQSLLTRRISSFPVDLHNFLDLDYFLLYLFIQASPNCITTNPTVSVFTACSTANGNETKYSDIWVKVTGILGVGQFLVNIKSNCFPTLGVTGVDWTFDVDGHLMLKGRWEHQLEYWNQFRRMSSIILAKNLGVFKELQLQYNPIRNDSNTVALNKMSKPVPPSQNKAQKSWAENDIILAKNKIKSSSLTVD